MPSQSGPFLTSSPPPAPEVHADGLPCDFLDDEKREFMDPATWDWDSIEELPPASHPSAVLPIRFSLDEMRRVGQAAEAEGLSIYEYVKQATLVRVMESAPR